MGKEDSQFKAPFLWKLLGEKMEFLIWVVSISSASVSDKHWSCSELTNKNARPPWKRMHKGDISYKKEQDYPIPWDLRDSSARQKLMDELKANVLTLHFACGRQELCVLNR